VTETNNNVFQLPRPGTFPDPFVEVFAQRRARAAGTGRRGRGCRLAQLQRRQAHRWRAASGWCVTDICPRARS
jgi:hypothetical protein